MTKFLYVFTKMLVGYTMIVDSQTVYPLGAISGSTKRSSNHTEK